MIYKEETTDLLKELVAIKSEYFSEKEVMNYVNDWLLSRGINSAIHEYYEEKVTGFHGMNVISVVDGCRPGPVICLNGHLDTVKLCSGWTKGHLGEQEGDLLYGQGALDMKSGCSAILVALEHFVKDHPIFKGTIKTTFSSVEEGPYGMGTNALIEDGYLEDVDLSLICEPSAAFTGKPFPDVCLGARGGYGLEIHVKGKSTHAANPEKGISAVVDAASIIKELENIEYIEDKYLGKGTCCVVAVSADGGACSVPDLTVIKIFWHIVVGETTETIINEIEKAVKRADIKSEYEIIFREAPSEGSTGFMPYTVSEENEYVKLFYEAVREITDKTPTTSYFQSIGDFNYLGTRLNAPAILFGADGENYHSKDEYVILETVYQTSLIIYKYLETLLL